MLLWSDASISRSERVLMPLTPPAAPPSPPYHPTPSSRAIHRAHGATDGMGRGVGGSSAVAYLSYHFEPEAHTCCLLQLQSAREPCCSCVEDLRAGCRARRSPAEGAPPKEATARAGRDPVAGPLSYQGTGSRQQRTKAAATARCVVRQVPGEAGAAASHRGREATSP